MEEGKRIRLVFKDDDVLSEDQKLDGLSRSFFLLKPHQNDAVSDLASNLLRAFQLHQSCPNGLLLSVSGFVLPPFESTDILNDNEIISVRKRRDVLSIEGINAANDAKKLKPLEKQPVKGGVLLLANEEFEKEKGGYESDESEEDEGLIEDSSSAKANKTNRKRKAAERLEGCKEKKQRSESKHSGNNSDHVCEEKKVSVAGDKRQISLEASFCCPDSDAKGTADVQVKYKETDDAKIIPKETKKGPSRSARRKYAKRQWLREMAKIQKLNANCESEGLRNWKEDQAKADKEKLDGELKQKWGKNNADAALNKSDGQRKGLLHGKLSSQNNWIAKGKKHIQHTQNGDGHKQQNQNGGKHEQPNCSFNEIRPGHIRFEPLEEEEQAKQQDHAPPETCKWNGITSKKKGQQWGKENRRFTPPNDYTTKEGDSETSTKETEKQPNGGINFDKLSPLPGIPKEGDVIATKETEKQPNGGINFDKLPPFPGIPKEGDVIAYQILELSSTWTPELSPHRVGKVFKFNAESNQMVLLPLPEYPIDEADNSLYKGDGSLEIDFSSLIDVRVFTSESGNEGITTCATAAEPSPEIAGSIWEQLSESVSAKKEENRWGCIPKQRNWVKISPKPQPSRANNNNNNSWAGSKSSSYKSSERQRPRSHNGYA